MVAMFITMVVMIHSMITMFSMIHTMIMAWSPWFCHDHSMASMIWPWSWHGFHDFPMIMIWPKWFHFLKLSDEVNTVNQVYRFSYPGPYAVILRRHSTSETHRIPHHRTHNKNVASNGSQKNNKAWYKNQSTAILIKVK